jgi:hypothetical protein
MLETIFHLVAFVLWAGLSFGFHHVFIKGQMETADVEDRNQWINLAFSLPILVATDSLVAVFYKELSQALGEYIMLMALICLITRLLGRIAYNMLFSLQVKHYGLLRHFFTREEWRVVIGILCSFHVHPN